LADRLGHAAEIWIQSASISTPFFKRRVLFVDVRDVAGGFFDDPNQLTSVRHMLTRWALSRWGKARLGGAACTR
jgi:hypothetical protein